MPDNRAEEISRVAVGRAMSEVEACGETERPGYRQRQSGRRWRGQGERPGAPPVHVHGEASEKLVTRPL